MNLILFLLIILTICIVYSSSNAQTNGQSLSFDIDKAAEEVESLYESKKISEAAQRASEILAENSGIKKHDTDALGRVLFWQGRALADLGQYKEALNPLLEAERFYSAHFPEKGDMKLSIDVGLGDCYLHLKQLDKALFIYKNIEKGDEMNKYSELPLKVYHCLASIYLGKRDYQKAIESYEKYLSSFKLIIPNAQKTKGYDEINRKKESLKAALKAKSLNYLGEEYKDGFIPYKVENEGAGMMDFMYAAYLVSELPDPSQKDLDEVSSKITKIEVASYVEGKKVKGIGRLMEEKTFKQLSQNQIKELFQCIKIKEEDITHVMHIGDISFKIFEGDNLLGTIRYVSNGYIRWEDKWKDDALLLNPTKFLEWLASIGIDEPLKEAIKGAKQAEENNAKLQKWASVAPQTLINQIDPNTISQVMYSPTTGVPQATSGQIEQDPYSVELYDLLKAEIHNETELILTLFKVYGNNFGTWSGFPTYELLSEKVLMLISIEKLNQVIEIQDLTAEHKEGIARFLSGWHFMQKRQSDISKVSQKTKEMLLKHLREKGEKEKIKLFKRRVVN